MVGKNIINQKYILYNPLTYALTLRVTSHPLCSHTIFPFYLVVPEVQLQKTTLLWRCHMTFPFQNATNTAWHKGTLHVVTSKSSEYRIVYSVADTKWPPKQGVLMEGVCACTITIFRSQNTLVYIDTLYHNVLVFIYIMHMLYVLYVQSACYLSRTLSYINPCISARQRETGNLNHNQASNHCPPVMLANTFGGKTILLGLSKKYIRVGKTFKTFYSATIINKTVPLNRF